MLKQLAKQFAKHLLPLVMQELIYLLEDLLKQDFNNDGAIGRDV